MRTVLVGTALLLLCAACEIEKASSSGGTVEGLTPVGSSAPSEAALSRFGRRAHLDLTGEVPDQAFLDSVVQRLTDTDNATTERLAIVQELVDSPGFGSTFVGELQSRAFGGSSLSDRMDLACIEAAAINPTVCTACQGGRPCDCGCAPVQAVVAEQAQLEATADDLADGLSTSQAQRRHADSGAFRAGLIGDGEGQAERVFQAFLGRAPEQSERQNAGNMVLIGFLLEQADLPLQLEAAGYLFGRHGQTNDDLLDIVFESEPYREAIVTSTFDRYLGRPPSAQELSHFVAQIDAQDPDAREVIAAVVASREYFGL